jgi:hypothetical protein
MRLAAVSVVSSILAISSSPAGRISWMSLLGFAAKVFQLIAGTTFILTVDVNPDKVH